MGCKSSKAQSQLQGITYEFPKVQNSEIDGFFNKVSQHFWKSEIIRKRFVFSSEKCYELSGTNQLLRNKYIETIRILMWSISAGCQGQIARSGIKIVDSSPFISLTPINLCDETQALYKAVREYLDTVIEGAELIKLIIYGLNNMKPELIKLNQEWIDQRDTSESAKTFRTNTILFYEELAKLKLLLKVLVKEKQIIEKTMPEVRRTVLKADEFGILAYNQKFIKPLEIFERFIAGEKRRALELAKVPTIKDPNSVEKKKETKIDSKGEGAKEEEKKESSESQFPNSYKTNPALNKSNIMVQDQSLESNQTPYTLHKPETSKTIGNVASSYQPIDEKENSFRVIGANKIQVNAPEMKNLALQEPIYQINENQYPYYKFTAPSKETPQLQPTLFKNAWETNIKSLPSYKPFYKAIDYGGKDFNKENYSNIDSILEDINKKYGPFNFNLKKEEVNKSFQKLLPNDENIEDEETETNFPVDNSLKIRHFAERRQFYMVTMKD